MNVDIGGGTSKIAICADGRVADLTALDVGARLICLDPAGRIVRIEEAGRRFGAELGINLEVGGQLAPQSARALAARMADCLFEAMDGGSPAAGGRALLRLDPLSPRPAVEQVTFSGGVAEYIYEPGGADLRRSRQPVRAGGSRPRATLGMQRSSARAKASVPP